MIATSAELLTVLRQYNPWWRGAPIADLPGWQRRAFHDVLAWMQYGVIDGIAADAKALVVEE
jgi:hypothetical protein